jgi:hypothetical protein
MRKVQKLEERVAKIEEQKAQKASDDAQREERLKHCVQVEADQVYWDFIKLNGTKTAKGYSFSSQVQDQALSMKHDKIDECKLLYSR